MNLEEIGLVQLSTVEVQETDGGFWGEVGGALLVYGIVCALDHPQSFLNGLMGH